MSRIPTGRARGVGVPTDIPRTSIPGANRSSPSPFGTEKDGDGIGGYTRKGYEVLTFALDTAQTDKLEIEVAGTVVALVAGDSDAVVSVTLDRKSNDEIPLSPGASISGIPFEKLWLTWAAQSGLSVTLLLTSDSPGDRVDTIP